MSGILKIIKKFKIRDKKKLSLLLVTLLVLGLMIGNIVYYNGPTKLWGLFIEHGWLELASGLLLYIFVDIEIRKYGDIPIEEGRRDYDSILQEVGECKNTVSILDNDFSSFFENENNVITPELIERLVESLCSCILQLENESKIKILLLHPNTLAAKQRNEDLQIDGKDLFLRMNDGLQFLQGFIDEIHDIILHEFKKKPKKINLTIQLKRKEIDLKTRVALKVIRYMLSQANNLEPNESIAFKEWMSNSLKRFFEVRLFKSSYSVEFISWGEKINFGFLPPSEYSNKRTFRTLQRTELAKYFLKNFEKLWKHNDVTFGLEKYKKVIIRDKFGKVILSDVVWGHDGSNHDIPFYVYIPSEKYNNEELENELSIKSTLFQIIHDNEMQWGRIEKLEWDKNFVFSDNLNFKEKKGANLNLKSPTAAEFAKKQIYNKSGIEVPNKDIYFISYQINKNRIELIDKDYVRKHLEERGYCYTSYSKYEVQLGLHLSDLLKSLYHFIAEEYDEFLAKKGAPKAIYQRLFVFYTCEIKSDGQISVNNYISKQPSICNYINADDLISHPLLDKFFKKTIGADLIRIFGVRTKMDSSGNFNTNGVGKYFIRSILIKATLDKKNYVDDWYFNGFKEDTGMFTVLHFLGKRNVVGGVPFLWFDSEQEPKRAYSFNNVLDSIYFKRTHRDKNGNDHKVRVDSSGSYFYPFKNGQQGYRNLVAIEIFRTEEEMLDV